MNHLPAIRKPAPVPAAPPRPPPVPMPEQPPGPAAPLDLARMARLGHRMLPLREEAPAPEQRR